MKLRNEVRNVTIAQAGDRQVEGVVRTRTLDARVDGRGFVLQRSEPVAVVVRGRADVRRLTLGQDESMAGAAALVAGPALYLLARRLIKKGRKK